MLEIWLKGLGVGLAIAAPVGPIGVLCIRRSVAQGRAAGLATGMGAAAADATYGMLVAAGFAMTGILVAYAPQMQAFGGVLIAWLGLSTLRGFLARGPAATGAEAGAEAEQPPLPRRGWGAFGSTYLLTLSNPMTILAFAGMVAGLGGAAAGGGPLAAYVLVLGVFMGSALWWLFLVQMALIARARIAAGALRWLDLVAGAVLLLWGAKIALGPLMAGTFPG